MTSPPELLEVGRGLAAEAGLAVDWVVGDAETLPVDDGSFDLVLSTFGCMFAPRHELAARHPTVEAAEASAAAVPGSWLSALTYDPFLWWAERSGMADRRRGLLASAAGEVLELGAGTGLNLPHYPEDLDRLVLAEPEEHMARRLRKRLNRLGRRGEPVRAAAEELPFDDASFDTVVSTLVLCTVEDPGRALAEIRRVLRLEGVPRLPAPAAPLGPLRAP